MVVLRRPPSATGDFGGTKLSLLLEKQHNRGQDGAGAAILRTRPVPGEEPYWIAKSASATPLADVLGAIGKRKRERASDIGLQTSEVQCPKSEVETIFLGHLRYATFGKNDVAFCHPFVHESSELANTLLLAGNFNLTNSRELFDDYARHGSFPTSKADGYLICELIAHEMERKSSRHLADALANALKNADGAWTLCGATGEGWAFATRDPHGIRPGYYYIDDDIAVAASERPAIQAAFDVPPEAVKELPPGEAMIVSPNGKVTFCDLDNRHATTDMQPGCRSSAVECPISPLPRPCSFERIYFSRANDADIHRERKALGAALLPHILDAADAPLEDIFFSYIPNSARIAFHGLLEAIFSKTLLLDDARTSDFGLPTSKTEVRSQKSEVLPVLPRFGEVIVKDAKFRTFIADAAARREFYKHVYDVTYGLVRPGKDTLVVLDDSIVRGNTMKNAILPMLDRLGPRRIVIASSAPPIRYPDCYGIDMSTLGELVAFRALVNLLDGERGTGNGERGTGNGERELREALAESEHLHDSTCSTRLKSLNPLASLYARFTEAQHTAEIARLLTPPDIKAEVVVVYQTIEDLHKSLAPVPRSPSPPLLGHRLRRLASLGGYVPHSPFPVPQIGDWYFTGDYPTPGGYKVLHKALENYLDKKNDRSY